ncbi:phosphatidylglycerophosphate phosphatase PTPMT2-like [Diospyros lotus]|uniref:phosphatidylglycerophosphate phosphatase PTPMT2-like n=1 Tax=Diospyros lotus TaxID=55363 RepID=UPI002250318E|nr:phosphatidylglycerophosphate phosphatase PTPMT2-like [Diospyros lotus]XP_052211128.1 phosphatidylglycerophosphate phosphatase PTPMT2-like [Diospyros lotus]
MHIEELKVGVGEFETGVEEQFPADHYRRALAVSEAKQVLVGAGARVLFYPTLLYNVVRNKIQSEFRWWDRVDEFILLGAVPFPADVPRLKELGVSGVVTLNESYETLVPASLYHTNNIDHLVIPTRDYLFAPSYVDICKAVDFIHENASCGKTTYVHCKAGRGRSTTIVLCYLVEHKQMAPEVAFAYVRSIRPRVLLASSQWQAVQDYYFHKVKRDESNIDTNISSEKIVGFLAKHNVASFDDASVVMVTESDLDGYDGSRDSGLVGNESLAELSLACRVQFASQAAITRLSCLWLRCYSQKTSKKKLRSSVSVDQLGSIGVNVQVY